MTESKKPTLQFSVICDDIANFHDSGKLIIVGLFEQIIVDEVPASHQKMWVLSRFTDGLGDYTCQTKIVNPTGEIIFQSDPVAFSLKAKEASYNVNGQIFGLPLEHIGTYWVETYLNDEYLSKIPLIVTKKMDAPAPEETTYH
ncbi:MAG: hypothetical protein C4562_07465 [Actinobacteria bacterium]|nr:MAG: hypothetical protein C4562_07465 [Actinomycetota bacterium]